MYPKTTRQPGAPLLSASVAGKRLKSLTKREVENLSAGIQELDLKCAISN